MSDHKEKNKNKEPKKPAQPAGERHIHREARRLAAGGVMAALIFCATYFIKLPIPGAQGYVHIGDGFVFLAAVLLPTPYAVGAAAIGAGLADLIGGYPLWLPATIGVRAVAVLLFDGHSRDPLCPRNLAALAGAAAVNILGYWAYESAVVYGNAVSAVASMPPDLAQSAVGAVIFIMAARPLVRVLRRDIYIRRK